MTACPTCGYKAASEASLKAHASFVHKLETAKPSPVDAPAVVVTTADTREAWMLRAVEALRPRCAKAGATVPDVYVSIGWPGGRGNKQHVVGQCWMPSAVADGKPAIFVSPVHKEPVEILETVLHEMIHAAGNTGHRGGFAKAARGVGFTEPFKSTPSTAALKADLQALAHELGPFPHAQVRNEHGVLGLGPARPPVQSTRMLKVSCPTCGYTLRTTAKWLAAGIPTCPNSGCADVGLEMSVEEKGAQ